MRNTLQSSTHGNDLRLVDRALIGAGLLLAMLLVGVRLANAVEIIPSVGITRAVNTDVNASEISAGLALRSNLTSFLLGEIGASYRSEERFKGDLHVQQWPITASLWLAPVPMFYVGGGAGWYHTTLNYNEALSFSDETQQQFGVHLGGGLRVPLATKVNLDLGGRYVVLEDVDQKISTTKFDPDYWTTSLGLAIKF